MCVTTVCERCKEELYNIIQQITHITDCPESIINKRLKENLTCI
jgi:hypothetical protein